MNSLHAKSSAVGLAAYLVTLAIPSHAMELELSGGWRGSLDTTLTLGSAWRLQDRDPTLIGVGNGGQAASVAIDDGNLNFAKGDAISSLVRATHELDVSRGGFGIFGRLTYAYDEVNARSRIDAYGGSSKDVGREVRLLDLYARYNTAFNGNALALRAGQQVLNWGESLYIQNGLSVINPVDLAKLRAPGTELREAYIPTPMIWASQQLTTDTSMEGFVLFKADTYRLDPRGTFFSTNDVASGRVGGGAFRDRLFLNAAAADQRALNPSDPPFFLGGTGQFWLEREADKKRTALDQFGVNYRVAAPELNQLELGLYAMQYTSRVPFVSYKAAPSGGFPQATAPNPFPSSGSPSYFLEYPSRIRVAGLSGRVQGPWGLAIQGEYSYRPNQPVQLGDLPLKAVLAGLQLPGLSAPTEITRLAGTTLTGYERVKMHQVQVSATKSFGALLGSTGSFLAFEIGATHLGLQNGRVYDGPGVYLASQNLVSSLGSLGSLFASQNTGFTTKNSWGYVLAGSLDYSNSIAGITISPRISFSHDVRGTGPTFTQGLRSLSIGTAFVTTDRQWKADLSYTNYSGGRTYTISTPSITYSSNSNLLKDRDFVALSVSYAF